MEIKVITTIESTIYIEDDDIEQLVNDCKDQWYESPEQAASCFLEGQLDSSFSDAGNILSTKTDIPEEEIEKFIVAEIKKKYNG